MMSINRFIRNSDWQNIASKTWLLLKIYKYLHIKAKYPTLKFLKREYSYLQIILKANYNIYIENIKKLGQFRVFDKF